MEETEAREVMADFTNAITDLRTHAMDRIERVEDSVRQLRQRSLIAPANADAPILADPLLQVSKGFHDWLRGARGSKSTITVQFPFRMVTKATPVLNAGPTVTYPVVQGPRQPALRLVELLPDVPLSASAAVSYAQEVTYTPNAGVVAEGGLKPETIVAVADQLATVKTIATITKVSIQSLADAPGLQQWLDSRLRHAVMLKAEDVFLNAAAPDGLLATASALHADYTPGTGATALDFIGGAIGQLQAQGYSVDGVVMSGLEANRMRLLKNTQGEYLWTSPDSALGVTAVWSVPTIISPVMPAGQFLVGAFRQSTILFTRQALIVEIAFENEDDFVHNLACLRAEERAALAIPVPQGLVKGTLPAPVVAQSGTTVPSAKR